MLDKLKLKESDYVKTHYSASDYGKSALDIYFALTGVPQTNPVKWNDTLKFGAGKGVEAEFLSILQASDIVEEGYDQNEHGRIEIEREGLEVTGYIDAIAKEGYPIEIKSINNKNAFDINKYNTGNPRENYVGQLSVYMDALEQDKGVLLVGSIDGLHSFWYDVRKIDDRKYQVKRYKTLESIKKYSALEGEWKIVNDGWIDVKDGLIIDLDKEYKRWCNIQEHIVKEEMPDLYELRYKYPLDEIDWKSLSKDKISKARNNRAVIGDWQVQYSSYKDKIVELQGTVLGYTQEELDKIKELTDGYTTWK